MYLTRLSLTNFRNFARLDLEVPRRVVFAGGQQRAGKTSLLEAVYYLATFSSFQTHTDRQLGQFSGGRQPFHRHRSPHCGRFPQPHRRAPAGSSHHSEPGWAQNGQRARKEILLDGVRRTAAEAIGQFNAVLYIPQMSQVLEGGPEERRRLLNLALAQVIPGYARALSEYQKSLEQRNALLKLLSERGGDASQLDFWDASLAESGAQILLWRAQAVQELERLAKRAHLTLTRGKEVLRLKYLPAFDPLHPEGQLPLNLDVEIDRSGLDLASTRKGFQEALRRLRAEEIQRGVTTIGPHRDDLRFLAGKLDLSQYGSRGQVRTTLLSLKLAEAAWMKEKTGQWPVILLDEVMAELDAERRADLQAALAGPEQSLLTTTDEHFFTPEFVRQSTLWRVRSGAVE